MKQTKLGANYIYSLAYRLSICILPIIVTPYLARVLSSDNNGLYVFTSTVACFFIMFCKLGLESYGNRTVSACRDNDEERSKAFFSIYALQIISSFISIVSYIILINTAFDGDKTIYWIQLLYVCTGLFDVSWFFYGIEQFKITTIRSLLVRALIITGIFVFVKDADDVLPYTLVMSASFLLEQLILFSMLPRFVRPCKIEAQDVIKHLKPNLKLFIPIMALNIYHWVDKLMLGAICGKSDVAFYDYAESIVTLPKGILQALGSVMLPRAAYLIANRQESKCKKMLTDSIEFISFISCGMCFGIIGIASVFVPFFLGEGYLASIPLVMELGVVIIPMAISDIIQNQYLVPYKLDNLNMAAVTMGAAANIILNAIFIPFLGASGAVIATLAAELCVCLFLVIKIRSTVRPMWLVKSLIPYILAGIAEAGLAIYLSKLEFSFIARLAIQVVSAGGLYLILIGLYFVIRKKADPDYKNPITRLLQDMASAVVSDNK